MSDKQKPIFGLNKLPAKAYAKALEERIKELNIENGKNTSYIFELEHKLKEINHYIETADAGSIKKEKLYNQQKATISKLTRENLRLQKTNKELINKIINLKDGTQEKPQE